MEPRVNWIKCISSYLVLNYLCTQDRQSLYSIQLSKVSVMISGGVTLHKKLETRTDFFMFIFQIKCVMILRFLAACTDVATSILSIPFQYVELCSTALLNAA